MYETSFNFISREGVYILNTQNSTSLTSGGCLTILGGASINKRYFSRWFFDFSKSK